MSGTAIRDPFEVADIELELPLDQIGDERPSPQLETWVGRGLLVLAVLLALVVDLRLANAAPNYQAGNEAANVAYLEQVALHGTPPVLGKDSFEIDPKGALPPRTIAIRRLQPPTHHAAPAVIANAVYPQQLALERPSAYYVAAPIAWVVPWQHRVLALRLFGVLLTGLSIAFLWAAVREAWPANPLAAGVAAIVLATMGGLIASFVLFQPEALLLTLWCAGMWLALRDARRRACNWSTVAVWAGATFVSSVAVPAAVAVVAFLTFRAFEPVARSRQLILRVSAVLASTVVWIIWNLHAYGDVWPLNTVPGAPDRPRDWHQLRVVLDEVFGVNRGVFDGIYTAGLPPLTRHAQAPAGVVAGVLAIALLWSLLSGRIAFARRALARVGTLLLVSFLSIYLTLFVSSVVAGAQVDYGANHFGGYAAAWAGVVGVGFTAPFGGRRRLGLVAVAILTVVLASVLLKTPIA
jgi:hypothetical protein